MLLSAYTTMVYMFFLVMGLGAPFVFSLGYVWVDTFYPQYVATQFLNQLPVSMIMAVAAIGGFFVFDRRKGSPTSTTYILLAFAVWVTMSTAFWAEVPQAAWNKWDFAFKTICFSAFVTVVFRSRVQIEALLQVYLFSIGIHFIPVGLKTMISGGGYGRSLGLMSFDSLLAEGSTLAGVSLMLVPIILYLRANSRILPRNLITNLLYIGMAVTAIAAAIGTYERTALIGLVVVGGGLWLRTRRKILAAAVGLVAIGVISSVTSSAWNQRISTIDDFKSESSALGRILVWEWTLDYVAGHPFGGGFNDYMVNTIVFPTGPDGQQYVEHGKAFHSVYFEVLGEQGWVGLGFFGTLISLSFYQLQVVARRTRRIPEMTWAREMAYALQVALLTLLACGAFIGIAFQPMLYYLFAISACLRQHVRKAEQLGMAREPYLPPVHPQLVTLTQGRAG